MGRVSIGDLIVKITAQADQFDNVVNKSEKKLAAFGAKAAAPITSAAAAFGGIPSLMMSPLQSFTAPISALIGMMPGGSLSSASLLLSDLSDVAEKTVDRTKKLYRESDRFGISPKFLRTLEVAAGPDADAVPQMLTKFNKAMVELRSGVLNTSVDTPLEKKLRGLIDPEILANANSLEDALRKVADAEKDLVDPTKKAQLEFALFGRSGLTARHMLEGGSEGFDKWGKKVDEIHSADSRLLGGVQEYAKLKKDLELEKEKFGNVATAIELPSMKGDIAWKKGQGLRAMGYWADSFSRRFGRSVGILGDEDLLKMLPKFDEKKHALDLDAGRQQAIDKMLSDIDDKIKHTGKTFREVMIDGAKSIGASTSQLDQLSRKLDEVDRNTVREFSRSLREQAELFGKSAFEASLYRGALASLDEPHRNMLRKENDVLETYKLIEMMKTPGERAMDSINEIQDRINRFAFTDDSSRNPARANALAAYRALDGAFGISHLISSASGAAPLIRSGSQESYSLRDAIESKGLESQIQITWDQIKDLNQQMVEKQDRQISLGEKLLKAAEKDRQPQTVTIGQ